MKSQHVAACFTTFPGFLREPDVIKTTLPFSNYQEGRLMGLGNTSDAWRQLPSYGHSRGVAGVLAGQHEGVLLAAGGTNFPDRPPWEGGTKKVYDEIYAFQPNGIVWTLAGQLPQPRSHAAIVSLPSGMLILGGENGGIVYDDSLWVRWNQGKVSMAPGPLLPAAMSSPMAVVSGSSIYLAPGYTSGTPRLCGVGFWRLDLKNMESGWHALPECPGPARAQGIMAELAGDIYLFSGIEIIAGSGGASSANYLTDAYRYRPGVGWSRLPDMPRSAIAAPTPAPVASGRIFVLGGVDGRLVGKQPRDVRVPKEILLFDVTTENWLSWNEDWPAPVVTAPAVPLGSEWIFVSGETMAGVRTPEVWSWNPERSGAPVCFGDVNLNRDSLLP